MFGVFATAVFDCIFEFTPAVVNRTDGRLLQYRDGVVGKSQCAKSEEAYIIVIQLGEILTEPIDKTVKTAVGRIHYLDQCFLTVNEVFNFQFYLFDQGLWLGMSAPGQKIAVEKSVDCSESL